MRNQFMMPLGLSANRLAAALHVSPQRIGEILNGRRGITAETALRLAKLFGSKPKAWLDLQSDYELSQAEKKWAHVIDREIHPLTVTKDITFDPDSPAKQSGSPKKRRLPASPRLTGSQKKVYGLLSQDGIHFDILCEMSGLNPGELSAQLIMLELSGLVRRHPGNRYSKTKSR